LYLTNNTVLDTVDKTVTELPLKDTGVELNPSQIGVTPNNVLLYANGDSTLYAFDPQTDKNWLIKKSVLHFTILDNTGYFVEILPDTKVEPVIISSAFWNGSEFKDFQSISKSSGGTLYITNNKELFCECSDQFLRVNQKLETVVASNNNIINLDHKTSELSFLTTGNELLFYNFLTNKPQILTRGGLNRQTAFIVRSSIGYAFIGNENGLEAIEIDNRDKQNRYQLLTGKQVWQIAITDNQKTIIALQDGALVSLDIRN
jgi:hypothetical protein